MLRDRDRKILGIHWSAGLVHWRGVDSGRDSVSNTRWAVTEEDTYANLWLAHILMYAHIYACIHTHISVCTYPCMHTYIHILMCEHIHVCIHMHVDIYAYIHAGIHNILVCAHIHACTYTHIGVCIHVCMHTDMTGQSLAKWQHFLSRSKACFSTSQTLWKTHGADS